MRIDHLLLMRVGHPSGRAFKSYAKLASGAIILLDRQRT